MEAKCFLANSEDSNSPSLHEEGIDFSGCQKELLSSSEAVPIVINGTWKDVKVSMQLKAFSGTLV